MAVERLHKDWKSMLVEPPPLCYAEPIGRNIYRWEVVIMGPPKSPFEGTALFFEISVPADYPHRPPRIRFIHPIYHPNISTDCVKYTSQTAEIIADLPFKNKIQQFRCDELSNQNFEPQKFAEFIEKNADKRAKFCVHFLESVDEDFKTNFIDTVRNHIRETLPENERPEITLFV